MDERKIYVTVAGSIQTPVTPNSNRPPLRTVIQPIGRQAAQACHIVSKLRHEQKDVIDTHETVENLIADEFKPITTIILQARDSAEMGHVFRLLHRKRLSPVIFSDNNPEYGPGDWPTAVAVFATKKQIDGILDYLPLWGSK